MKSNLNLGCNLIGKEKGYKVKIDNKTIEAIKVISLVIIAISSVCIAFWLAQMITLLEVIGSNLNGMNTSLFDLVNK
ncbi:hypothetical protein V7266_26760 [Neobacillus drentensis]|uniref:hypothetical protein n=1 Tax=Neobacillus drentensis TaxID=220684 RepID=UPI003000D4C9